MKRLENGLKRQKRLHYLLFRRQRFHYLLFRRQRFHYCLGLTEKKRKENAGALLKWYEKIDDPAKKYNQIIKIYAEQLKKREKG